MRGSLTRGRAISPARAGKAGSSISSPSSALSEDRDMKFLFKILIAAAAGLLACAPAQADRIKDLGSFQGLRENQLTGYGIVVGLAGTGDDSLDYAVQGMKGVAARFGTTLPPGVSPALKNAAAVMITADLPAFARPGQRLDITVSAMGRARSPRGGSFVNSAARCAHHQVLARVPGHPAGRRLGVPAQDGSQVSVNVPS